MSIDDEFKRVLNNPDNVIVSDELSDLLRDDNVEAHDHMTRIQIGSESLVCKITKLLVSPSDISFTLDVPALSIKKLLTVKDPLEVIYEELSYRQTPSTDILWEDNLLTLKARRIFNEAV